MRERVDKPTRLEAYFAGKSQREKGCETLQTYEFTDLRTQKTAKSKAHELKKRMNPKAQKLKNSSTQKAYELKSSQIQKLMNSKSV